MGCIQSIGGKARVFREGITVIDVKASIDPVPTSIDESSNVVLRYRTPHFRASAQVIMPPIPKKETWIVGWIQACSHMEFYNQYGEQGIFEAWWVPIGVGEGGDTMETGGSFRQVWRWPPWPSGSLKGLPVDPDWGHGPIPYPATVSPGFLCPSLQDAEKAEEHYSHWQSKCAVRLGSDGAIRGHQRGYRAALQALALWGLRADPQALCNSQTCVFWALQLGLSDLPGSFKYIRGPGGVLRCSKWLCLRAQF
ncbi:hypothetical protein P7K49_001870 [Saguinus oedipus]|uniref:Family with sequence similarity 78 member A n=1 Tax=Saguinus oedipus TaxID=9490 RepID=A0ABQ9WFR7_SAGOE|nr:hypothetical protein P7K49_001870 [Saguinus oedipus]